MFQSNEIPYNDTWDGEDRASAIKYGTVKQVFAHYFTHLHFQLDATIGCQVDIHRLKDMHFYHRSYNMNWLPILQLKTIVIYDSQVVNMYLQFFSNYNFRVVIYERKVFIRLTTDLDVSILLEYLTYAMPW